MPENVTKRISVTFGTGLPLGEHASFTHDGRRWIAYPIKKNTAILTVIDRLLGIYSRMAADMTDWINSHPTDGARAAFLAEQIGRARRYHAELADEKVRAVTS